MCDEMFLYPRTHNNEYIFRNLNNDLISQKVHIQANNMYFLSGFFLRGNIVHMIASTAFSIMCQNYD